MAALNRHSLVGSMGRVGAAGDNAAMESFFALLQKNVLNRGRWVTRDELRIAIVTWIERSYHHRRRQRRLGRMTPVEFETIYAAASAARKHHTISVNRTDSSPAGAACEVRRRDSRRRSRVVTPMPEDEAGVREFDVLREVAEVGYSFDSLADLRTSGLRYREAVPVLLSGLQRATGQKVKGEIVRALSVPWAKPIATGPLIEQFRKVHDDTGMGLRWTVGNALEVVWDDARFDDLVALVRDESFGKAREMVVLGLGRSKKPEAGQVLVELLGDPIVSGHAVKALRKLKVPAARPGLEQMLSDERAWVRKEAERALAALG